MTEEVDVFGNLDVFCNKDLIANYKCTAPVSVPLTDSDHDDDESFNMKEMNKSRAKSSTKKSNNLENELFSASTHKAVVKGRKSKSTKSSSTLSKILDSTLSSANQLETKQAGVGRYVTRSMRKLEVPENNGLTQPKQQPEPIREQPLAVAKKAVGRAKGKKQTPSTIQTVAQTNAATIVMTQPRRAPRVNVLQQMITRRSQAALKAAQSTNVDYIDLVSSPLPRIEGVINVDSEEETTTKPTESVAERRESLDLSFDDENPEISVKVMWNGSPEVFKLRKYQKLSHIFQTIAEREGVEENNLVFNVNNKIINPNDTPASINYKIYEFIYGRIFVSKFGWSPMSQKKRDTNKILLKIQSDQWKRPLQIELLKTDTFKILYIKCAEELNTPYEKMKLSFDGEPLELNDTPADLELEGGEAIDLRIRK